MNTPASAPTLTRSVINGGMTYAQYRQLFDEHVAQERTTGPDQSTEMQGYTRLNHQRTRRIEAQLTGLLPEAQAAMAALQTPQTWLVLTEIWCGDAAQNLPIVARLAEASPKVALRLVLRDEHPAVMDAFLTNGARSILKLIAINTETLAVLFTWGPRPAPAQALFAAWKQSPSVPKEELYKQVQGWYNDDKGVTVQRELMALVQGHAQVAV